jgi:hypothetical protein
MTVKLAYVQNVPTATPQMFYWPPHSANAVDQSLLLQIALAMTASVDTATYVLVEVFQLRLQSHHTGTAVRQERSCHIVMLGIALQGFVQAVKADGL